MGWAAVCFLVDSTCTAAGVDMGLPAPTAFWGAPGTQTVMLGAGGVGSHFPPRRPALDPGDTGREGSWGLEPPSQMVGELPIPGGAVQWG